jgi:hypothetical protein
MATNTLYKRNIYSDELLKTIYVDTELNYIKEADKSNPDGNGKENYDQVTKTALLCLRCFCCKTWDIEKSYLFKNSRGGKMV